MNKQYLGDGVYVDLENGMLLLTTENGIEATNRIYLETAVWNNLATYVRQLEEDAKERARPAAMRQP